VIFCELHEDLTAKHNQSIFRLSIEPLVIYVHWSASAVVRATRISRSPKGAPQLFRPSCRHGQFGSRYFITFLEVFGFSIHKFPSPAARPRTRRSAAYRHLLKGPSLSHQIITILRPSLVVVTFGFGFRLGIHKRLIQMRLLFFVLFSVF
jgi:hypothetical protein